MSYCRKCRTRVFDRSFEDNLGYICDECLEEYRDWFDNYPVNPHCDICGKELDDKFYNLFGDKYCEECLEEAKEVVWE